MNTILHKYLRKCVLVFFFYDILVYNKSWEDHIKHLRPLLGTLLQQKFYANRKKCKFGQQEVKYQGHVISLKGVETHPEKLAVIYQWPTPTIGVLYKIMGR